MPLCVCVCVCVCVCAYLAYSHTQVLHHHRCCSYFRTDDLVPNIWYQSVGGSSTRCRSSLYTTQHSVFISFEEQRRKKKNKKLASHCVKSQIGVSQQVVLCFCDCNRLRGASYATPNTIVLHLVKRHLNSSPNAIHSLVVTTRCRSVVKQQPISRFIRLIDILEDQLDPSLLSL